MLGTAGFALWYESKRLKRDFEFLRSTTVSRCSELGTGFPPCSLWSRQPFMMNIDIYWSEANGVATPNWC
ncbi:unnamed protein product, partial [Linum tenue]